VIPIGLVTETCVDERGCNGVWGKWFKIWGLLNFSCILYTWHQVSGCSWAVGTLVTWQCEARRVEVVCSFVMTQGKTLSDNSKRDFENE
jgi:hypothetical protein